LRVQVREFAERVLFADTLEDKLSGPDSLEDDRPGTGLDTPAQPGRPTNLQFRASPGKFDFPGTSGLEDERRRAKLLHFFANHELLATELMALVLLKFPDAPRIFRSGVVQTLKEEQQHTRMYMRRLKQLGIEFGEHDVNDYFWRTISTVESPMDYVSRLSLTFEQANLDYTRFYSDQFARIGDESTRALLDRIYQDEIGHVNYGLNWFQKWKDPNLSDWAAFERQLAHPLSPSRAKAEPFNAQGRLDAGIDPDFIDELYIYSKSKGRTPSVHLFNPFAESYLARSGFEPNKQQAALACDLETLPMFFARRDDVVLVNERPRSGFLAELKQVGFEIPEFVELQDGNIPEESDLRARKLSDLRPWAWSPDALKVLEPLFENITRNLPATGDEWEPRFQSLFSKVCTQPILKRVLEEFDSDELTCSRLCTTEQISRTAHSVSQALTEIEAIRQQGHQRVVAKAAFGVAGSNQLRLWEPEITPAQHKWLGRTLADECVVIEPWLERALDFSFQFDAEEGQVKKIGLVKMRNDKRGQFQQSIWTPRFAQGLTDDVAGILRDRSRDLLGELHVALAEILTDLIADTGFQGPMGIDAFVYRQSNGELRIHPVVELNARNTMGRLMIELMRRTAPGRSGKMELVGQAALKNSGCASFEEYAAQLKSEHPLQLRGEPRPKINSGAVCLNDPSKATGCLATLVIE
tara:strand:+ start:12371 stop:14458 length:2088 start_codon:yes stop_codon:yes gene_type:complete